VLATDILVRAAPRREEAKRSGRRLQHVRCDRTAQPHQHIRRAEIGLQRCARHQRSCRQARDPLLDGCEPCVNCTQPPTKPAYRAGQGHIEVTQGAGGGLHARGRGRCGHNDLDRRKQARKPGREEVRQKTERSMALAAVPTRDAKPLRRHTRIAAVPCDPATAIGMKRARRQASATPFLLSDVGLGTRQRMQRDLHGRSPTRR